MASAGPGDRTRSRHRLAREAEGDEEARAMLLEVANTIESLPPERAEHLVQLLLAEYGG